jgi:hypothetical protein
VKQGKSFPFSRDMQKITQNQENYNKHDSEWAATRLKPGTSGIHAYNTAIISTCLLE